MLSCRESGSRSVVRTFKRGPETTSRSTSCCIPRSPGVMLPCRGSQSSETLRGRSSDRKIDWKGGHLEKVKRGRTQARRAGTKAEGGERRKDEGQVFMVLRGGEALKGASDRVRRTSHQDAQAFARLTEQRLRMGQSTIPTAQHPS